MALTTESIHAAADQLHADGITPTQTKVREALGGGSFSTIGEALKSWKQDLHEHEQLKKTDMPDTLKDEATVMIAKLWQAADQIANANLQSDRDAIAIEKAKTQSEIDGANEAISTLEAEQAAKIEQLRISNDSLERAVEQKEASAAEVVSLIADNTDLQHKLDIEQERTSSATFSLRATSEKLDATRAKLDDISSQLTQSRESIATYKATSSAQVADIERLQADAVEHKKAHQVTIEHLTERTAERDALAKQLASVSGKLESIIEQNSQIVAERDSASSDNKTLAATNVKVATTNERLIADIASITAERDKLADENAKLKKTSK